MIKYTPGLKVWIGQGNTVLFKRYKDLTTVSPIPGDFVEIMRKNTEETIKQEKDMEMQYNDVWKNGFNMGKRLGKAERELMDLIKKIESKMEEYQPKCEHRSFLEHITEILSDIISEID